MPLLVAESKTPATTIAHVSNFKTFINGGASGFGGGDGGEGGGGGGGGDSTTNAVAVKTSAPPIRSAPKMNMSSVISDPTTTPAMRAGVHTTLTVASSLS